MLAPISPTDGEDDGGDGDGDGDFGGFGDGDGGLMGGKIRMGAQ